MQCIAVSVVNRINDLVISGTADQLIHKEDIAEIQDGVLFLPAVILELGSVRRIGRKDSSSSFVKLIDTVLPVVKDMVLLVYDTAEILLGFLGDLGSLAYGSAIENCIFDTVFGLLNDRHSPSVAIILISIATL